MIGMDVPRNAYYEKELQVRLSRSYGPGRYDRTYEEQGVDYPAGYVRWTEQRNMEGFLDLVAGGRVQPSRLVTHRFPIAEAERSYEVVTGTVAEPYLGILLEYPHLAATEAATSTRVDVRPVTPPLAHGGVRLGVIGARQLRARRAATRPSRSCSTASSCAAWRQRRAPSSQQTDGAFWLSRTPPPDWHDIVDDRGRSTRS